MGGGKRDRGLRGILDALLVWQQDGRDYGRLPCERYYGFTAPYMRYLLPLKLAKIRNILTLSA
ncbi:hypothetical protein HNR46_000886 [Haloferula luteola]|uniref:Uncharacterized protein n=1 Tax=Haloferula luteola TaxID=595692 RepID=A0A840V7D8_9BACT|nr:hypothetical protein [Haloferula luteola]